MGRGRARAGLTGNESKNAGKLAPPPNVLPPSPHDGRVAGRVLTPAEVAQARADGVRLAQTKSGVGDPKGAGLAAAQGFDGKATVVDRATMDQLITDGGTEIFRGVGSFSRRKPFLDGQHFAGLGIYGNGMYAAIARHPGTIAKKTHNHYQTALSYAKNNPRSVVRMTLKKGAKIGDYDDLVRKSGAPAKKGLARSPDSDVGYYAAAHGYDAYVVKGRGTTGRDDYVVILNRTALIMQREAP